MIDTVIFKPGPFKIDELKPGEIQQWGPRYYLACPRCGMALGLDHKVTIVDGKVSIEPSVGHETCKLHIFIRDSKIRYLSDL